MEQKNSDRRIGGTQLISLSFGGQKRWDWLEEWWLPKSATNSKGCDIGYALDASSCEGVNNVDACTVTALDAITAFAVPDPNLLLAEPVGFFGSGCSLDRSIEPDHSVYFGSATVYFD